MKKLVIANWKMNPKTPLEAKSIAKGVINRIPRAIEVILCPPSIFWNDVAKIKRPKNVYLGTQNVFFEDKGAFTGEISASMAKESGATFSIIGHSERRMMGESDDVVAKKVSAAKNVKIIPIICVGEKERDSHGAYLDFLKKQIISATSLLSKSNIKDIVIAYEPLWAIGKDAGGAMNSHDVYQTSLFIRKVLIETYGQNGKGIKVLYGGSVAPENCFELVKNGEVDGLLVGNQSLIPENFIQILTAVSKIK